MATPTQPFGRRGPIRPQPVVTHAPAGLPGGHPGPSAARKSSLTVGLIAVGAMAIGGAAWLEGEQRADACRAAQSPQDCPRSSGGGHSTGGGHWFASGSSGGATSAAPGAATSGHAAFGGFGGTGAAHAGGGHGGGE
jgi:hypothetical protein